MILRVWRGYADRDRPDAYPTHFRDEVVADLQHIDGFLGADLARRDLGDEIEFTVLTRWESMDSVTAFAGSNAAKAVVEPGAVAALRRFDTEVVHHAIVQRVNR